MDNTYVILNSENKIVNIIIWNGDTSIWQPPENCTAILLSNIDITNYEYE